MGGMIKGMKSMEAGDLILLHACAHNPTGVDPSPQQWDAIINLCKERKLLPLVDNAYQGYASGDLVKDNKSVELLEASGIEFLVSQSFAKNLGLYGERIGYVHVVC